MRIVWGNRKLLRLYHGSKGAPRLPGSVIAAFFDVVLSLRAATDERRLYAAKGMHCEKLKGKRAARDEYSVRLNDQWRLVFTIEQDLVGKFLRIIELVDYHKGKRNV